MKGISHAFKFLIGHKCALLQLWDCFNLVAFFIQPYIHSTTRPGGLLSAVGLTVFVITLFSFISYTGQLLQTFALKDIPLHFVALYIIYFLIFIFITKVLHE